MAINLDMEKVYDRFEWSFINKCLLDILVINWKLNAQELWL